MDPGPDSKRPRLANSSSWSTPHHVSLPQPSTQLPHHPSPPGPYQPPYPPRASEPPPPPHPGPHHLDDRRHHEQEPYTPMQDHYRPPASPAHPSPFSSYPPRDVGIKRDPDEAMNQPRRPHSTGNVDGLPPGPHQVSAPPPGPQGYQDDPRRHMSFDSGPQVPPTPGGYRAPSFPTTPIVQPHPFDHNPYPVGPPPGQDPGLYNIQYSSTNRRKATRASQACESCRNLKAKCDEMMPCKTCKEKGLECKYRAPIQKQADKAQTDLLEGMGRVEGNIDAMLKQILREFTKTNKRMNSLEILFKQAWPNIELKAEPSPEEDIRMPEPPPPPPPHHMDQEDIYSPDDEVPDDGQEESMQGVQEQHRERLLDKDVAWQTAKQMEDENTEDEPGEPVAPGESKIPANHTTLASFLLTWPAVRKMVASLLEREKITHAHEFPIHQEQARGLLRVYGKGEGYDLRGPTDRSDEAVMADHGSLPEMGATDDRDVLSDIGSSPHPSDWGQLGGLSPASTADLHYHWRSATLTPEGNPDFSEGKVREYLKSFEDNVMNMHPIIPPRDLHALVQVFLDDNPSQAKVSKPAAVAKFVSQSMDMPGGKRKRSPVTDGDPGPVPKKPGKPYRSMNSCLVLLIMALGKVCLHKGRLPDVVRETEKEQRPHGSPMNRNGHPASPLQGSPPGSQPHTSGLPSPKLEQDRMLPSRRSSFQGGMGAPRTGHSMKKNYDQIPGLEYFAYATDILGNQMAGGTLKHVWANILAGLYHGQLARPIESFVYIAAASRALLHLIRPSLARIRESKQPSKKSDNQLVIAFWTCLQLESDLLAEMPLIHSGILNYEEGMPYPNMLLLNSNGVEQRVCESYIAQLYLRKHLNKIHNMFFSPKSDPSGEQDFFNDVEAVRGAVANMMWVGPYFKFQESDHPASDILSARLRAKYWGAQVITYRFSIKQCLGWEDGPTNHMERIGDYDQQAFKPGVTAPIIHPDTKIATDIEPKVIEYAKMGIYALIESTRAFHGLPHDERPIITNIFGTAHAQWGNLLVLAACYESEVLHEHVNPDVLRGLFTRTINFFRLISNETSALKIDLRILENLEARLFYTAHDPNANRSFSSGGSAQQMGHPMPLTTVHQPPPPMEGGFAQPPPPMPMTM